MSTSTRRRRSLRHTLAAILAAGGLAACSDPFEIKPNLETVETTFTLHAINGSPPTAPTAAVLINTPGATRIGSSFAFDLAFDVTDAGKALLYPVDLVASDVALPPNRYVGYQVVTDRGYDALVEAPNKGYTYGQPLELQVGTVGFLQSNAHPLCTGSFTPYIYAKFRVDAVDVAARTVKLTVRSDPNCGFRGLQPGLPTR
ncbi:MAG TPA: hypothetical protein VGE02_09295 [Gemmatimonadales bacterium]